MKSYTLTTGTFIGKGGVEIFFQSWTVPSPRGILVIAHGVGEHSDRYGHMLDKLDGSGISVYANDHRGHGKSGGPRGHVDSFMEYIYDMKLFIDFIKEENGDLPLILMGHSMGGVIAFKYSLTYPEDMAALILSSAGLIPAVVVPSWKVAMGKFFSKYIPSLAMSTGLNPAELSHDKNEVEAYENDPLVHDKVSSRWYTEYMSVSEECLNRSLELRLPLLVFHGKNDLIVDYKGSVMAYNNASSMDKTLHVFDNLYHETMNEKKEDREKVLDTVKKWILRVLATVKTVKRAAPAAVKKKKAAAKPKSKKTAVKKTVPKKTAKKSPVKKSVSKKAVKKTLVKKAAPKKAVKRSGSKAKKTVIKKKAPSKRRK